MTINIDVTLRDGAYRNGFAFPFEYALKHARLSVEAGFDWVEIAYRKGSYAPKPDDGLTGRGEDHYIAAVADAIGPEHVCVILHPKNITESDLPDMYAAGARLVRICLPADDPGPGLDFVRQAKELGFIASVNLTRVSQLPARTLVSLASGSSDAGADVVYLADSNGSLSPDDVAELVSVTRSVAACEVGLHAHNNLGLALSNAIRADEAGAGWMDSAVLGMGKGPGNLIAEQWLAHLERRGWEAGRFDLGAVLDLSELLLSSIDEAKPGLPLPDLVLGHFDLSVEHRARLVGGCGGGHREKIVAARALSMAQ